MSNDDEHPVSARWSQFRAETDLEEYYSRWRRLEATGVSPHGEADFIESLHPKSVLDAGCGMGRVSIELARRGIDVVGVDLDDDLLEFARRSEPSIRWVRADLATMRLDRRFDVVATPGNVMVFCRAIDRVAIIETAAAHLEADGLLVAGFQLESGSDAPGPRRVRRTVRRGRSSTGATMVDVGSPAVSRGCIRRIGSPLRGRARAAECLGTVGKSPQRVVFLLDSRTSSGD